MSSIQYFPRELMDMGSLLGSIVRPILNYKRDPHVNCYGPLN